MTHLDLFSGIGGFALAAYRNGFQTIGFSEIEPYACKILKRHWPTVPNYGDIRNVPAIKCELITGGPPCQPASCAGHRKGAEDDRWLWPQTLDCVERVQPTFCLFENPTGLLTLNGGVEFEGVLSRLESLGYAVQPIIVPAVGVDARHRRERVWIIAYRSGEFGSLQQEQGVGQDSTVADNDGQVRTLADHDGGGLARSRLDSKQERDSIANDCGNGENVADTKIAIRRRANRAQHEGRRDSEIGGRSEQGCRVQHWLPEPGVGRVADGIPNRSHRLRGLGNAIVPQVASEIIRAMISVRG